MSDSGKKVGAPAASQHRVTDERSLQEQSPPSGSVPTGAGAGGEPPAYWLPPITEEARKPHGCMNCEHNGAVPITFPPDGLIAAGFGFAAVLRDGRPVLEEPQARYNADFTEIEWEPDEDDYPTGAKAEEAAAADPDHDWRIQIEGPLSGRTYQRQGANNWVLVEQNEGFA